VERRFRFWQRWLIVVTIGVAVFGLTLVVAPTLARRLFGLLIYASPFGIDRLGAPAAPYITLVHGVLGAVMFGWAIALLFIVIGPFGRGSREGWLTMTVSLTAWFVPDTAFSLWTGFWPNAVLNLVFATLFAIPLAATYRAFRQRHT
jgi:hypothetical protein